MGETRLCSPWRLPVAGAAKPGPDPGTGQPAGAGHTRVTVAPLWFDAAPVGYHAAEPMHSDVGKVRP
jgi:hypothetical protein